ncbi:MAG: chemotaxis protein CheW [Cyanobacteria bacterium P01_A01_bin.15]
MSTLSTDIAWSAADGTPLSQDPLGLEPISEDTRRRFLRFKLSGTDGALLPLQDIAEVMQLDALGVLPVPDMPGWLLGVCNWRGEMLWLVDVNVLVGGIPLWHQTPTVVEPMAIVIQAGNRSVGLVVDLVHDVELVAPESIHPSKEFCSPPLVPFVVGHLPGHGGAVLDATAMIEHSLQTPS